MILLPSLQPISGHGRTSPTEDRHTSILHLLLPDHPLPAVDHPRSDHHYHVDQVDENEETAVDQGDPLREEGRPDEAGRQQVEGDVPKEGPVHDGKPFSHQNRPDDYSGHEDASTVKLPDDHARVGVADADYRAEDVRRAVSEGEEGDAGDVVRELQRPTDGHQQRAKAAERSKDLVEGQSHQNLKNLKNNSQIIGRRSDGQEEEGEHDDEEQRGGQLRLEDAVGEADVVDLVVIVAVVDDAGELTLQANVVQAGHLATLRKGKEEKKEGI